RLVVDTVLREEVLIAVPPGHSWAKLDVVRLADAVEAPDLLLSMRGIGLRKLIEEAADTHGAEPAGRIELRSLHALLAMVASGGGVSFAPAMALRGRTDVVGVAVDPPLERKIG